MPPSNSAPVVPAEEFTKALKQALSRLLIYRIGDAVRASLISRRISADRSAAVDQVAVASLTPAAASLIRAFC